MKYKAPDGFENRWIRGRAVPSVRIGKARDGMLVPNSNFVREIDGPHLESLGFVLILEEGTDGGTEVLAPKS